MPTPAPAPIPKLGDTVLYNDGGLVLPGIITKVHSNGNDVDLVLFNANNQLRNWTTSRVNVVPGKSDGSDVGSWFLPVPEPEPDPKQDQDQTQKSAQKAAPTATKLPKPGALIAGKLSDVQS